MITREKLSDYHKNMNLIVSHQESLRSRTAARTEAVQGILQSNLSNVSSNAALVVENAQQRRDQNLKDAQQTYDDTVSKAKRVYDETVANASLDHKSAQSKIHSEFDNYKANAEMDAKSFKQELGNLRPRPIHFTAPNNLMRT